MSLDWGAFTGLSGDPRRNFEVLYRSLVQRKWARFGRLRSVRQQPGVEFHLQLTEDCELGTAGKWFGWQCKWLELRTDNHLRAAQKRDIEESIEKAIEHVSGLTDVVICLKELPSAGDVGWLETLGGDGLAIHVWGAEQLEAWFGDDTVGLRNAFFGELGLTVEQADDIWNRSISAVRGRWMPELNTESQAELALRRALVIPDALGRFGEQAEKLALGAEAINDVPDDELGPATVDGLRALGQTASDMAELMKEVADSVAACEPIQAIESAKSPPPAHLSKQEARALGRSLRSQYSPGAPLVERLAGDIRRAHWLISDWLTAIDSPMMTVVASAGDGKSHLAAEIASPNADRPAGVFMRAALFSRDDTLDTFAGSLPGFRGASFEDLLEAVDALAQRSGCRLPIVIDGLTESEMPSNWRNLLQTISPVLPRYTGVQLVLTTRPSLLRELDTDKMTEIQLEWGDVEASRLVRSYLDHFMIDPGDAPLPGRIFSEPLFLRLFCEAVNGEREGTVGAEAIPTDEFDVLELYLDKSIARIAPRINRDSAELRGKLLDLSAAIWDLGSRRIPYEDARSILDGTDRAWNTSFYRALEDEGLVIREGEEGWDRPGAEVVFDRFAGFLIAAAVSARCASDENFEAFLSDEAFWDRIGPAGSYTAAYEHDVYRAMIALVPRRFPNRQLWQMAPEEYRGGTLANVINLAPNLIDEESVALLGNLIADGLNTLDMPLRQAHLFDRLWSLRNAIGHPLNASFTHAALVRCPLEARDRSWTEWVRQRAGRILDDVEYALERWDHGETANGAAELDAQAFHWLLTSNHLKIRDTATKALAHYGAAEPANAIRLAIGAIDVDDPYVVERTMASLLGGLCATKIDAATLHDAASAFCDAVETRFVATGATRPTSHALLRDYMALLLERLKFLGFELAPALEPGTLQFRSGSPPPELPDGASLDLWENALGMDFSNYVVGGLFHDRGNYDLEHGGYQSALREIALRIRDLGWDESLAEIDRRLPTEFDRPGRGRSMDRYAKKYSWISYYELIGRLGDLGQLTRNEWDTSRESDPDIDPTFPERTPPRDSLSLDWLSPEQQPDSEWCVAGPGELRPELLAPVELDGDGGPWILTAGSLVQREANGPRDAFAFFHLFSVDPAEVDRVVQVLSEKPYPGNHWLPDSPSSYETWAGTSSWSSSALGAGQVEAGLPPYESDFRADGTVARVEVFGQGYDFEWRDNSALSASGAIVASARLAQAARLHQDGFALNLLDENGNPASKSYSGLANARGRLLYLRADVLQRYVGGKTLVQVAWGELNLLVGFEERPEWLDTVRQGHSNVWRQIQVLD